MLSNRLVCGINDERIQRRLLSEDATLTLKKAIDIAQAMESSSRQSALIQNYQQKSRDAVINKVTNKSRESTSREYYRCGGRHNAESCPFDDKNCFLSYAGAHSQEMSTREKAKQQGRAPVATNKLEDSVEEESHESNVTDMEGDHDLHNILTLEGRKAEPIMIGILIDGISLEMELDTGASVSVISENTYQKLQTGD